MIRSLVILLGVVLVPGVGVAQRNESGAVDLGTAAGQPGELVQVPVLASFDAPLRSRTD
jgi:hypothetical protein